MANDWEIKGRADRCAVTGHPFGEGEIFYTLLFKDKHGFHREDWCEAAWAARTDKTRPFSFWKSKFEPPAPPEPEPLGRESAENLLRRSIEENAPEQANTRYILGLMLERKRILKQVETRDDETGRTLIYTHTKTGEVFVIPDPQLRLDLLESVQTEIASQLS